MATFIETFDVGPGPGLRLAVKDLIDMAGIITTAGCRALANRAKPAEADAACLAGARAAEARIVGKANLSELAYDAWGDNRWFGNPVNPLDPTLITGGSSSGSAVAVATGEADVAYGSDTGGSVRIPSACCGTVGLKTTWGRVPLDGVWPLAQSLDTIGPMATTVAGVAAGMALLEPGFTVAPEPARSIGRLRTPDVDPAIDAAIDRALAAAGLDVVLLDIDLRASDPAFITLISGEAWANDHQLLEQDRAGVSDRIAERVQLGAGVTSDALAEAAARARHWRDAVESLFERVELLALPTLVGFPPPFEGASPFSLTAHTSPFNVSGSPAVALPVPAGGPLPASLQLVGPLGGEELLCATAAVVEQAVA